MYNSEFEKKVQQRLSELDLTPPENLWDNIAAELPQRKRSYRWVLLLLVFTLAGSATGWWVARQQSAKPASALSPSSGNSSPTGAQMTSDPLKDPINNSDITTNNNSGAGNGRTAILLPAAPGSGYIHSSGQTAAIAISPQNRVNQWVSTPRPMRTPKKATINTTVPATDSLTVSDVATPETEVPAISLAERLAVAIPFTTVSTAQKAIPPIVADSAKMASPATSKPHTPEQKKRTANKWQLHWMIGGGWSSINKGLSKSSANPVGLFNSGNPQPILVVGSSRPENMGEWTPAFGFTTGLKVSKDMGKRWSFHTGLQYTYYTAGLSRGQRVDSPVQLQRNGILLSASYYYQGSGKSNTSNVRFHYLESPLTLQYTFNKRGRVKGFVEAGASLSYLLSTNTIVEDAVTRSFLPGTSVLNRWALSATGGVGARLSGFTIGTRFSYGFSSVVSPKIDVQRPISAFLYLQTPIQKLFGKHR